MRIEYRPASPETDGVTKSHCGGAAFSHGVSTPENHGVSWEVILEKALNQENAILQMQRNVSVHGVCVHRGYHPYLSRGHGYGARGCGVIRCLRVHTYLGGREFRVGQGIGTGGFLIRSRAMRIARRSHFHERTRGEGCRHHAHAEHQRENGSADAGAGDLGKRDGIFNACLRMRLLHPY
jgi:hypothetical protein